MRTTCSLADARSCTQSSQTSGYQPNDIAIPMEIDTHGNTQVDTLPLMFPSSDGVHAELSCTRVPCLLCLILPNPSNPTNRSNPTKPSSTLRRNRRIASTRVYFGAGWMCQWLSELQGALSTAMVHDLLIPVLVAEFLRQPLTLADIAPDGGYRSALSINDAPASRRTTGALLAAAPYRQRSNLLMAFPG